MTTPAGDLPDWIGSVGGTSRQIFNGFVAGAGSSIPVAQFNSVQVVLFNLDNTSVLTCEYQFKDSASGLVIESGLLSADANHSIAGDGVPTWGLPVIADTLLLVNSLGNSVAALVIGRPQITSKKMLCDFYPARNFTGTVPANSVSGTRIQLAGQDGNTAVPVLRDCSGYNGLVTANIATSGAITGQVQYGFRDKSGTVQHGIVAALTAATAVVLQSGHPFAYTSWSWLQVGTSPASAVGVTLILIPAEISG